MRLDFYSDSRKKHYTKFGIAENFHGIDEYVKDWHPRKTQVLQDILTALTIILMSRIFKKGFFRIWLEFREYLGFIRTPFEERVYYKEEEETMFYHGNGEREDFVMMMCNHFDQHVLLYGFERNPCLDFQRTFPAWYVPREVLRQRGLKVYKFIKDINIYSDIYYIRPDYS